jgi:allantoin racemase
MARVLVVVPYPLDETGVANRRSQLDAVSIAPDIEFVYQPVKASPKLGETYHDAALFDLALFECGCDAEAEGFDAVCLDTVSDAALKPLRAVLTIPVVGAGSISYYCALMLGRRFSVLTQWDRWVRETEDQISDYGLADRCVSVRSIGIAPKPSDLLGGSEQEVFPLLLREGRACIEDGADVICLGSTTMHQAHAYLSEHLSIPIINPGPLTYKVIELMLSLGLSHSKTAYPTPDTVESGLLHAMLDAGAAFQLGNERDG